MKLRKSIGALLQTYLSEEQWRFVARTYSRIKFSKFRTRSLAQTFDEVYAKGLWAPSGSEMLSGSGSYGQAAEGYVEFLSNFIRVNHVNSITDIGCGDFNIGRQTYHLVHHYNAFDVSNIVIERNKKDYGPIDNVSFRQFNACVDPVPQSDLVILREVLQHLTNREIELVLANIEASRSACVLIADMSPPLEQITKLNVDLDSHGPIARNSLNSAVAIFAPPFSRKAEVVAKLPGSERNHFLYVYRWFPQQR